MTRHEFQKISLPDAPGVYLFKQGKEILYIGKATSLKERVKSYFAPDLIETRGPLLVDMVYKADAIEYQKTDSVVEALILESNLIKAHQPRYNTKEKDDRSYNYVVVTTEDFPRVLIVRGKNLDIKAKMVSRMKLKSLYGPFPNGTQLKAALKIIRKIFPFRDTCHLNQTRPCFNYQIGLCPGTCIGAMSKKEYARTIRHIELFLSGKKKKIIADLERDMRAYAKRQAFEKADEVKRTLFAINHIQDIALIKSDFFEALPHADRNSQLRIEAYDIAHISGTSTVGVMVVLEGEQIAKNEYRKFIIRQSSQNDVEGLAEVLERRFRHSEWRFPDIMVVDGSVAQKNKAEKVLRETGIQSCVVAVTKDERHRPKLIQGDGAIIEKYKKEILLANSEAHRFAIAYHRATRRKKSLL